MRPIMLLGTTVISLMMFAAQSAWEAPRLIASDSVDAGHKLALYLCSTCHSVDPKQEFPPALINPAPAFADIANRSATTPASLRHFLATTHGDPSQLPFNMPNLMLTTAQKDAAIAYIMSLRNKEHLSP